jgi:protein-L-isoaspartate(D-aspartate) O-methyltransferase
MSADLDIARENMVESQVRTADVTDLSIQDAIRAAPRHELAPAGKAFLAYTDTEIEYAPGRWMLKPRDIAKLLQGLKPIAGESALAISAPYAAMLLRLIGLDVTEIDAAHPLPGGGYDLIVCEGAVSGVPEAWTAALKVGGRLGVVERSGPQGRAMLHLRTEAEVSGRALFDATPPFLSGFAPQPRFAF